MIVYKVVQKRMVGGEYEFWSYNFLPPDPLSFRYTPGKKTTGLRGTPVIAFSSSEDARQLTIGGGFVLFRADAGVVKPVTSVPVVFNKAGARKFWKNWRNRRKFYNAAGYAFRGMVACDSITLLEEVR